MLLLMNWQHWWHGGVFCCCCSCSCLFLLLVFLFRVAFLLMLMLCPWWDGCYCCWSADAGLSFTESVVVDASILQRLLMFCCCCFCVAVVTSLTTFVTNSFSSVRRYFSFALFEADFYITTMPLASTRWVQKTLPIQLSIFLAAVLLIGNITIFALKYWKCQESNQGSWFHYYP